MFKIQNTCRVHRALTYCAAAGLMMACAAHAEQFAIAVGDLVSPGVPGPGAGMIEQNAGEAKTDTYTFQATTGQAAFFEEVSVAAAFGGWLTWDLRTPDGDTLFSEYFETSNPSHPGRVVLPETGTYTLRVRISTQTASHFGAYSFRVRAIPGQAPIPITIGSTVSNGVPVAGAGNIEVPGSLDEYVFSAQAGQNVFIETVSAPPVFGGWLKFRLTAPDDTRVVDSYLDSSHEGRVTLPEAGQYRLEIWSGLDSLAHTGTYAFRIRDIPPDPTFAINLGQTVSVNQPGVGAGSIEVPGAQDFYTFQGTANQAVFFQQISADPKFAGWLAWEVRTPSGDQFFQDWFDSTPTGRKVLPETGTYTVRCYVGLDDPAKVGNYSFKIDPIQDSTFALPLGVIVTNGIPATGAGRIEEAGTQDVFTFSGVEGQRVHFRQLHAAEVFAGWLKFEVRTPGGNEVLNVYLTGNKTNEVRLPATGQYSIKVYSGLVSTTHIGNYSFQVYSPAYANPDQFFASPGVALEIPLSVLLCNDTAEPGDLLSADFLALGTGQGRTLVTNAASVRYTSAPGFTGTDTFVYRLRGSFGATSFGQVTVKVMPGGAQEASVTGLFRTSPTEVRACVFGAPEYEYVVEESDSPTGGWQGTDVLMTDAEGAAVFDFELGTEPRRFFRFVK